MTNLFVPHLQRQEFDIYGQYCNNHPHAVNEMNQLQENEQYKFFFEVRNWYKHCVWLTHELMVVVYWWGFCENISTHCRFWDVYSRMRGSCLQLVSHSVVLAEFIALGNLRGLYHNSCLHSKVVVWQSFTRKHLHCYCSPCGLVSVCVCVRVCVCVCVCVCMRVFVWLT